jgi:opacity protein-like surface antigen
VRDHKEEHLINIHKSAISTIFGVCSLSLALPVMANSYKGDVPPPALSGFYLGAFGGWGSFNDFQVTQSGVAMFSPTLNAAGIGGLTEPLAIDAVGSVGNNSVGFGGIHLGYEWLVPAWGVTPAIELEGIYFSKTLEADLDNSSIVLTEHDFDDNFPTKTGVVLINGVLQLNCFRMSVVHPYVGFGLGAAILSINGANSPQVNAPEPGVNHFNSNEDSSDWTFAAQAKAGLRFDVSEHVQLFAEYRFLYIGNTEFTFGSTYYPSHVPTTSWKVDFENMYANSGALGIEFKI